MNAFNSSLYEKGAETLSASHPPSSCLTYLFQYQKKLRRHTYFHLSFCILILLEIFLFAFFFPLFAQSAILAFSLAIIFLTIFSYLILKIYFEAKKNENFYSIATTFSHAFVKEQQLNPRIPEYHASLANGYRSLADHLQDAENNIIKITPWLLTILPYFQKIATWWHWEDIQQIKEILLKQAILHLIELIKWAPTNLEVHASLANMYILLSSLYDPQKEHPFPNKQLEEEYKIKFKGSMKQALEEYKILKELTPNDPWVYTQLAYSYRILEKPLEEIETYEQLLKLSSNNHEILYKLGKLYFEQGKPILALRLYEQLKSEKSPFANELINFYGKENKPSA